MAKKTEIISDLPIPPIPKSLLNPKDPEYQAPEPQTPEQIRARLQLMSTVALDALEWHARNIADAKSCQEACKDILDRAGYVAPAKAKSDAPFLQVGGGGEAPPPVEEDVRNLNEAFSTLGQDSE